MTRKSSLLFLLSALSTSVFLFSCTSTFGPNTKTRLPACSQSALGCIEDNHYVQGISADESAYAQKRPAAWVSEITETMMAEINGRSDILPSELSDPRELQIKADRNALIKGVLYKEGILEVSDYSLFLTDKLVAAKVLEQYLGQEYRNYHMKTVGLKEFIDRHGIVDENGKVVRSKRAIVEILKLEFPHGLIAKPPVGYDSNGKSFFSDIEEIAELIVKGDNELYKVDEFKTPFKADFARRFTSGEKFIFQEKLAGAMGVSSSRSSGSFNEYRVHSFYNRVVEGATLNRWDGKNSKDDIQRINAYVQSFLDKIPASMSHRQGWSFDVFLLADGSMKIIEINTNRGLLANWSDWLRHPFVLGAYVRHLEEHFKWKFQGFSGWLLRSNLGGLKRYWWDDRAGRWHDLKVYFDDIFISKLRKQKIAEESDFLARIERCQSLWCHSGNNFFKSSEMPRVGLEVELTGLTHKQIVETLQKAMGGTIEERPKETIFQHPVTGETIRTPWSDYKLKPEGMKRIIIKPESNVMDMTNYDQEMRAAKTFEIITDPIDFDQVVRFQKGLDALKAAGAVGTNSETAVSIQVNIEMVDDRHPQTKVEDFLSILRNYYRPEHYQQISDELPLPSNRAKYVGMYSPGVMERIFDPEYRPTYEEFYKDFFYRQSAEYLEYANAWSDDIEDVEEFIKLNLKKDDFTKILKVFKWNDVRISSLLVRDFPNEWMSDYLIKTGWVSPHPIFEFRRPNNNFDALSAVKSAVGLVQRSREVGEFEFEAVVAAKHALRPDDIRRLSSVVEGERKPFVVGQILGDRDNLIEREKEDLLKVDAVRDERTVMIEVPMNSQVDRPYVVPGESVVWHRLGSTSQVVVGKYNPALVNANISTVLENKFVEAKFWDKYSAGTMPQTSLLSQLITPKQTVAQMRAALNKAHPGGWVVKGVYDSNTEAGFLITDKTDIEGELAKFQQNRDEFLAYYAEIEQRYAFTDPDLFQEKLKERPEFRGWKINRMLKKPFQSLVQERLDLDVEYRVEVVAGKVLGRESTVPRYYYNEGDNSLPDNYWQTDRNLSRVETFAQEAVDRLPKELKGMTFAMDIVVLKDGSLKMIESNPQGNSGFLANDAKAYKLLEEFLLSYPEKVQKGEIDLGMTERQQMAYLDNFLTKELKLDLEEQFGHLKFTPNGLLFTAHTFMDKSCEALALPLLK